jgi:hypothetical protein
MIPSMSERLANLDAAAHEWMGLLAYRLFGRTDALFPEADDAPNLCREYSPLAGPALTAPATSAAVSP